jgi:hypothetical protein
MPNNLTNNMKTLFKSIFSLSIFISILYGGEHHAQLSQQSNYYQAGKYIYAQLDKSLVTSGLLLDQSLPQFNPAKFVQSNQTPITHRMEWLMVHQQFYYSQVGSPNANLSDPFSIYDKAKDYRLQGIIPIAGMFVNYHQIRKDEQEQYFTLDTLTDQLEDTIRSGNPYESKTVFLASVLESSSLSGLVRFSVPVDMFYSNISSGLQLYSVDLGDGLGPRVLDIGQDGDLEARYLEAGEKTITAVFIHNNTTYTCKSTLMVESAWEPNLSRGCAGMCYDSEWDDPNTTARAYIKYGSDCQKLSRPLIIVEGFDAKDEYGFQDLYIALNNGRENAIGFIETAADAGYDVIILDFEGRGGADMRENGRVLERLINYCNEQTNYSEPLIVMGHSMGGVVSRWTLRKMELEGKNHNTRLYVSSDAPHQGANIPLGIQQISKKFNNYTLGYVPEIAVNYNALNSTAARQLLLSYVENNGQAMPEHTNFYNELDTMGYPSCKRIAISLGSPTTRLRDPDAPDMGIDYNPGDEILRVFKDVGNVDVWVATADVKFETYSWANSTVTNHQTAFIGVKVITGWWSAKDFCFCWKTKESYLFGGPYQGIQTVSRAYDHVPGGLTGTQREVKDGINAAANDPSLATDNNRGYHCIVPTHSSLDVSSPHNQSENLNKTVQELLTQNLTPFSEIFMFEKNNNHAGQMRNEVRNFLTTNYNSSVTLLGLSSINSNYNFGVNTPKSIASALTVSNNANVFVNRNQGTGNGSGNAPSSNSTFRVDLIACSMMTLSSGSNLELGDPSQPNQFKGNFVVNSGSVLLAQTGSKIKVNQGSGLTIAPNGILRVQNGAIIELNDAPLYLDGVLECEGSSGVLYVRGGGSIYVKENIVIPSGWKIELENDWTQIYLGSGATMNFANGAGLTLKDHNTRVHFNSNSTLNISSGAEFTFDGNGYILWGTNNLIEGTDYTVSLRGADKTDLVLLIDHNSNFHLASNLSRLSINEALIRAGNGSGIFSNAIFNRVSSSRFEPYSSYYNYNGLIATNGVFVTNTEFEGALVGLSLHGVRSGTSNTPYRSSILNCSFTNNAIGMRVQSRGLTLQNSTFNGNGIGVDCQSMLLPAHIANCTFENNSQIGINYIGSLSSSLQATGNVVKFSNIGINVASQNLASLECNTIQYNTTGVKLINGAVLDMNTRGSNEIAFNYTNGILFDKADVPQINLTKNLFEKPLNQWIMYGTITNQALEISIPYTNRLNISPSIAANDNLWMMSRSANGPISYPNNYANVPEAFVDYKLYYGSTMPSGSPTNSFAYLNTTIVANSKGDCGGVTPPCDPVPGGASTPCLTEILASCPSCQTIIGSQYSGMQTNRAIALNITKINKGTSSSDTVQGLNGIEEVLKHKYLSLNVYDYFVFFRGYQAYAEAVGQMYSTQGLNPVTSAYLQKLEDLSAWLAGNKNGKFSDPVWFRVNQAVAQYNNNKLATAIQTLQAAVQTHASSQFVGYAQYWLCVFTAIQNGTQADCQAPEGSLTASKLALDVPETEASLVSSSVKVFPNPIGEQTDLSLELKLSADDNLDIKLYDVAGKLIISQKLDNVKASNQTIKLNVGSLAKGVYTLSIDGQTIHHKEKVMVIK